MMLHHQSAGKHQLNARTAWYVLTCTQIYASMISPRHCYIMSGCN